MATIIVALPAVSDKINKISSEKAAHIALLYLNEQGIDDVVLYKFAEHAAENISPFTLNVTNRGVLGDKNADVIFFDAEQRSLRQIKQFRANLLNFEAIRKAYDAEKQFPEWTPHLTLGYPDNPAKPDTSEYPGFEYVHFDRIAVWTDEYEGPEFKLRYQDLDFDLPHSGIQETGRELLAHTMSLGVSFDARLADVGEQFVLTQVLSQ